MNSTSTWFTAWRGGPITSSRGSSNLTPVLGLSTAALLLGLTASVFLYYDGMSSLVGTSIARITARPREEIRRHFDTGTRVLAPALLGGAAFIFGLMVAADRKCRGLQESLEAKDQEIRRSTASLQRQISENLSLDKELRQSYGKTEELKTSLEQSNALLRAELESLKKAEKAFSQRRQELESSKTVLELHVEERSQELQRLQRRFELILNSAGEGICALDLAGRATYVNPAVARITGWPSTEIIGKTEKEIFGENAAETEAALTRMAGERMFFRKDGSCLPVEFVKTPINENGLMIGAVLIFKDITERKRVEETIAQKTDELTRSNAELEQFAFVASHDLQEPLRKIQAFGDRLVTKVSQSLPQEAQDYLQRMQNAAARMSTLISDLLTFSRVIRRSDPLVPVDLSTVARGVLSDLEVRIEKSGAVLDIGELPTLDADPMQMHQLLLNLISNALKFQLAKAKPMVTIRSRKFNTASGEPHCEISVQDNGIGFEEKYMDKIFAVFQRLHGRSEYEGTGVGLAVCRRITDRHHGTITARSALGQGSTFIVTLPMKQSQTITA
jgi:PAS domain S-box-containing protein